MIMSPPSGNCSDWAEASDLRIQHQRIQALLVITASMLVFLGVFGMFRRRCGNCVLALIAFGVYTLLPTIIIYTLALVQSAFGSLYFLLWAAYLVVNLGSVDSYTVHVIEEIEGWNSFNMDSAVTCFTASWMIASYVTRSTTTSTLLTLLLFIILFMKAHGRVRALMLASYSVREKKYKLIADYMRTEHEGSDSRNEDPATMRGYKYLVRLAEEAKVDSSCLPVIWRRKKSQWRDGEAPYYLQKIEGMDGVITVEKVWSCKGRLLSGSGAPEGRLKDLCLSFSLFKFICMRFADYSLPQEAQDKLRRLIQHMLRSENGHERVFRVIEVELALLFDLLFTKYPVNLSRGRIFCRLLLLVILVAALIVTYSKGGEFCKDQLDICPAKIYCSKLAGFVTILLMMSILVMESAYICIMIFSEWAKVTYICKYVQNDWWQKHRRAEKLIEKMCGVWLLKPWGRQLRQYSLLQAYSHSPWKCIYNRFTANYFDQERDGQKQIDPTNLSEEVTKAIARSLRNCTGNLEAGLASLRLNDVFDQLSWACKLETATHVIMVWHIATTFCEHEKPLSGPQLSREQRDNFGIATKLSKYLAYLVAFAPTLLPCHPCKTEYIFSCAVSEARKLLKGSSGSMVDRIQKLKSITDDEETIVGRGVRLGRQLVNTVAYEETIWKVLADFWAEMMLYVAPSDNVATHANYLTTGGEFVTHIWVLVTHVGFRRCPHGGEQYGDPESN